MEDHNRGLGTHLSLLYEHGQKFLAVGLLLNERGSMGVLASITATGSVRPANVQLETRVWVRDSVQQLVSVLADESLGEPEAMPLGSIRREVFSGDVAYRIVQFLTPSGNILVCRIFVPVTVRARLPPIGSVTFGSLQPKQTHCWRPPKSSVRAYQGSQSQV
jgi:hypothetical protein